MQSASARIWSINLIWIVMNNEENWTLLVWTFIIKFTQVSYLIARLISDFYLLNISPAKEILEKYFAKKCLSNKEKLSVSSEHPSLKDTINLNEAFNSDVNIRTYTIVWHHLSCIECMKCLKEQLKNIEISSEDAKILSTQFKELKRMNDFRNDLAHGWIIFPNWEKGITLPDWMDLGIFRVKSHHNGLIQIKEVAPNLQTEINNLMKVWRKIAAIVLKYQSSQ